MRLLVVAVLFGIFSIIESSRVIIPHKPVYIGCKFMQKHCKKIPAHQVCIKTYIPKGRCCPVCVPPIRTFPPFPGFPSRGFPPKGFPQRRFPPPPGRDEPLNDEEFDDEEREYDENEVEEK
eukprot:Seg2666.4 transcript_id=Seg2666.4/GoldUCD/mRNA.D3Y31 product="hypothetical protein" protein_id=Seg2666.4/GoldUCD/D3Y31